MRVHAQGDNGHNAGVRNAFAVALAAVALLAALVCAAAQLAAPAPAYADSTDYSVAQVDLVAEAQTDASLHVTEVRTFDLGSSFQALSWVAFDPLPSNARIEISSMRIGFVAEDGSLIGDDLETLTRYVFDSSWYNETNLDVYGYAYSRYYNRMYVHVPAEYQATTRMVISFDYTVVNGVQLFRDAAEIDWKYVSDQATIPSDNVTMQITLPVPSGTTVTQGKNLYVWGHGPESGTVSDPSDGTVTYTVAHVNADQYAEAHILLPQNWFLRTTDPLASANIDTMHWDWVVEAEENWSDASRIRAMQADMANIIAAIVCALLIIAAGAICVVCGRDKKADEDAESAESVRRALSLHPAVFGRVARWTRTSDADFVATIERLQTRGVVDVRVVLNPAPNEAETGEDDFGINSRPADIEFSCPAKADELDGLDELETLDRHALTMLFDTFAEGRAAVTFAEISAFAHKDPHAYVDAFNQWAWSVGDEVKAAELFDARADRWARILRWTAGLMGLFGLASYVIGHDTIMAVMFIASALVVGVFSYYTKRATQGGANVQACQAALQQQLEGLAETDGSSPIAADILAGAYDPADLLRAAYLLGVSDKAACGLIDRCPALFENENERLVTCLTWYAPPEDDDNVDDVDGVDDDEPSTLASAFEREINNAFTVAQSAIRHTDVEVRVFERFIGKVKEKRAAAAAKAARASKDKEKNHGGD